MTDMQSSNPAIEKLAEVFKKGVIVIHRQKSLPNRRVTDFDVSAGKVGVGNWKGVMTANEVREFLNHIGPDWWLNAIANTAQSVADQMREQQERDEPQPISASN